MPGHPWLLMLVGHGVAALLTALLLQRGEDWLWGLVELLARAWRVVRVAAVGAGGRRRSAGDAPVGRRAGGAGPARACGRATRPARARDRLTFRRQSAKNAGATTERPDGRRRKALFRMLIRRLAVGLAVGVAVVVLTAVPAAAHVTVSSPDAAPGGFGKLVVRVPNESDTASTTKLPSRAPGRHAVRVRVDETAPRLDGRDHGAQACQADHGGGLHAVEGGRHRHLDRVRRERGIAPGQFDEFELSLGAFPSDVDTLSFPTTQTYSDGTVVVWDQASVKGQDEPEHPVPTLELAAATQAADATAPDLIPPTARRAGWPGPRWWLPRPASCWLACPRSVLSAGGGSRHDAAGRHGRRSPPRRRCSRSQVVSRYSGRSQRPRTPTWSGRCPGTGRR